MTGRPAQQPGALDDIAKAMLRIEDKVWRYAGAKEQAIREQFDLSATQFYQRLNSLIETEAAMAFNPLLVKRLRRMRAQRQRTRAAIRDAYDL
jgi:hypothetical protein